MTPKPQPMIRLPRLPRHLWAWCALLATTATADDALDWWSLQPLERPAVPDTGSPRARTPVDHFVIAKLAEHGLALSPEADRRTLVRRLYYDLTGLPPTPGEVAAFVADESPQAYPELVERLLASPRYGERWARHWLDVVHYGDTHGYDKDKLRPNAYPYRDYVIRAFNEGRRYSRFVREQVAGDVLWPDSPDAIVATGFIAAGPWDFIGHAEVAETKIDGMVARHLDRDDMVANTMNSFCSLTVQCAQCHDHKRDPVTMEDYYSLQAVFAALDRADRPYDADPEVARRRAELRGREQALAAEVGRLRERLDASRPQQLVELDARIAELRERGSEPVGEGVRSERYGYHSQVAPAPDTVKWVQVDLGEERPIDRIYLFAADEYGFADFGFPQRFRVEVASRADFEGAAALADHTGADFPRPGERPVVIDGRGQRARFVRVTATRLWDRRRQGEQPTGDWIFALGELAVVSRGEVVAAAGVTALDSIEAGARWGRDNLIDGIYGRVPLERLAALPSSPTNGYHSAFADRAEATKWVQVDLGEPRRIDRVELVPARPTDFPDTPGFGFPVRFKVTLSDDPHGAAAATIADHRGADFPNPGDRSVVLTGAAASGRYLRVTAEVLSRPEGSGGHMLALAELRAFSGDTMVTGANCKVTALDSIDSGRWHRRNLLDGFTSRAPVGAGAAALDKLAGTAVGGDTRDLARLEAQRETLARELLDAQLVERLAAAESERTRVAAELDALPPQQMVYAGTVHTGSGTFRGTGHDGGRPRKITVLARGDVRQPGAVVRPGTVAVIPGAPARFELPPGHSEGERRVALAEWIVRPDNPLTWRSIVNRVWLYHFGRGIVDSPNDFGRMGELPTHPQLLDWLAVEFRDGSQSIKDLHRLIVNSAVYMQSSAGDPQAAALDGSNRLLWRMNRRKLEAEAVRDSILAAAGKLDLTMFGPGYHDFVLEKTEHSPHYQYHKHDPDDPRSHRRSIYRFLVRSQPAPFMDTLDCADPSFSVDKRNETLTALQALALLNNKFVVRMSDHFAARVTLESPDNPLARALELALARPPTAAELAELRAYADRHGLAAACRIILNLNEFCFVD